MLRMATLAPPTSKGCTPTAQVAAVPRNADEDAASSTRIAPGDMLLEVLASTEVTGGIGGQERAGVVGRERREGRRVWQPQR